MESTSGDVSGNTEDVTGRKKSRFKFLKVRLFGRLKKKETEGRMKQSQSTGDVTAQEGGRGEDDSEDDCHYPEGTLSSRALSHDSIFLADPVQSSQPTRVLSQENVHSKIKALQLKLQQQNMRLAPLLITGKRMEDSGTTSEDDGLPRSPPEMSLQEVAMQRGASKSPEPKSHVSLLSLAGTGSEEEEQGGFSQPSSRPLSPVPYLSITESPSAGVDFTSPAQYVPILDNSAARHRMSIKPRNQRASTKGKKPNLYRPRSSSMNSLDEALSEKEETQQSDIHTQIMHHYSYTSEDSTQAEESLLTSTHLQEEPEKATLLTASPWSSLNKFTEPIQQEDKSYTTSSMFSDEMNHTREPLAKEPSNDSERTNKINVNEEHQASLIPLSTCSVDIASDYTVRTVRTDGSLAASSIDQTESSKSTGDLDVCKPAETITRLHPVPAPRIKKPTLSNLNIGPPKVSGLKPFEVEKETTLSPGLAESPREHDKPIRPSSFRFNIASAKYRSKTSDENVAKQDEESSGNSQKGQAYNQNLVVQMEKVESTKSTEECRNIPSGPDKRSTLLKEVVTPNVSKTGVGDNPEKSEVFPQNTEYLKSDQAEESDGRRGLFGVKLRSTSLCLKYRSELPGSEAERKRHSLEGELILAVKEPVFGDVDAVGSERKANVQTNPVQLSLDSQPDPSIDKGSETDRRPEPAWRSVTREKTRVHQSFPSKSPTQPAAPSNSASLSTPQSSSTQQLSKPALQPRPQLLSISKPQPVPQSSQQIPPKTSPRAMERWTMSNQREDKSSVSQSTQRDELLDSKGQSKLGAKSNTQTEPDQQSPSDRAEPTWMELAKRKSLAWSDKTVDFMNF